MFTLTSASYKNLLQETNNWHVEATFDLTCTCSKSLQPSLSWYSNAHLSIRWMHFSFVSSHPRQDLFTTFPSSLNLHVPLCSDGRRVQLARRLSRPGPQNFISWLFSCRQQVNLAHFSNNLTSHLHICWLNYLQSKVKQGFSGDWIYWNCDEWNYRASQTTFFYFGEILLI